MGVLKGNSGSGPSGCVLEVIESGTQGLKGINGCGPVGIYALETIVECSPAEVARCCLKGNSGCGLEGSLGAV